MKYVIFKRLIFMIKMYTREKEGKIFIVFFYVIFFKILYKREIVCACEWLFLKCFVNVNIENFS